MSGYHVEHGIKDEAPPSARRRRPDLSSFFSTLDVVDTSGSRAPSNANALPHPSDISAAYRTLANAFAMMSSSGGDGEDDLMSTLISSLMEHAEHPPTKVEGVSDEFLAQLERVDKKELASLDNKKRKERDSLDCPICSNPFLEDPHPLVVRLPCHDDHLFDLDCIQPWLKLNPTCPLDRKILSKEKKEFPKKVDEDEEDFDDMYS